MPLFLLKIKADLENVAELTPQFENLWKFNIASTDGEERLGITVSKADVLELNGSKGDANYVMKWHKADSHQAYIKLVDVKKIDGTYKAADSGTWVTLLGLECRGLVPTAWIPGWCPKFLNAVKTIMLINALIKALIKDRTESQRLCRIITGVDFHAKSVGKTGTVFESIDLSDKEWAEYDEEGDLSISVMELEFKIE